MIRIAFLIPFLILTILPVYGDFHEKIIQFMPNINNFDNNWKHTDIQGFKNLELEWSSEKPDGLIQRFVFNDDVDKTKMITTVSVYDFSSQQTASNIFETYVSTLIENGYTSAPLDESLQKDCFATMINQGKDDEKTSITCKNSQYIIISTSEQTGKVFHQGQQLTTIIAANGFASIIYETIQDSKPYEIPKWIKNNAGWWANDEISDETFVNAMQFLIKDGVIEISDTIESTQDLQSQEIPKWIKNNAKWWANGTISDDDFVRGIQYLIENGIIQL